LVSSSTLFIFGLQKSSIICNMLCDRLNLQVSYGAGFIEFSAEEAKRVYGDIIPSPLADRRLFVLKQVILFIFLMF
jgi:hypothetical protein